MKYSQLLWKHPRYSTYIDGFCIIVFMEKAKPPKLSRKYKPKYGDEQNLLYPRRRCETLVEERPKNSHVYQFVALKSMG